MQWRGFISGGTSNITLAERGKIDVFKINDDDDDDHSMTSSIKNTLSKIVVINCVDKYYDVFTQKH